MAETGYTKRKRAAVPDSDVAGCSRLMQDDEEATLGIPRRYRATIDIREGIKAGNRELPAPRRMGLRIINILDDRSYGNKP